jgi:hypothetical protein
MKMTERANRAVHRSSFVSGVWVALSLWLLVRRLTASSVEFMGMDSSLPWTLVVITDWARTFP